MSILEQAIIRLYSIIRITFLRFRFRGRFICPFDVIIYPQVRIMIDKASRIELGNKVNIKRSGYLSAVNGGFIRMGNNTSLNQRCHFVGRENITIGDNCIFGPGVVIYDHDHEFNAAEGVKQTFTTGKVIIASECWIAANVTVLRNTILGKKSVVGAGVILQGNIPQTSSVTSNRELIIKLIY